MRLLHPPRRPVLAGAVAGVLLLSACGGSDGESSDERLPEADVTTDDAGDTTDAGGGAAPEVMPVAAGAGFVDLLGPDVVAASEFPENLLPDVVLDDVTNGRKVNFRNLVPQEKPILLWMYAPH